MTRPDEMPDGLLARCQADGVEVGRRDVEDEPLGHVDPEGQQDVHVDPNAVLGRDRGGRHVERDLPPRDEVGDDDRREHPMGPGSDAPREPASLQQQGDRALRDANEQRAEDAQEDQHGRDRGEGRPVLDLEIEEQSDDKDDQPAEHELVADPASLASQQDDREPAGGIGGGERVGRLVERDADLGQLDVCGRGHAPVRRAVLGLVRIIDHRRSPLPGLAAGSRPGWVGSRRRRGPPAAARLAGDRPVARARTAGRGGSARHPRAPR